MTEYELGNCLRGYFFGKFENADEAWEVLGKRFDDAFPSRSGRAVVLKEVVRQGVTVGGNERDREDCA